jgi:hypothetical protein
MKQTLNGVRIALLGAGYYLTYVMAFAAATAALMPLYAAADPKGWNDSRGFADTVLPGFDPTNLRLQGTRLVFILLTFWIARKVLRSRAKEGLGPRRWWTRYPLLVLLVAGVRLLVGVVLLLHATLPRVSLFSLDWAPLPWIMIVAGTALTAGGLVSQRSRGRVTLRSLRRPARKTARAQARATAYARPQAPGTVTTIHPTAVMSLGLTLRMLVHRLTTRTAGPELRLLLGGAAALAAAVPAFLLGGLPLGVAALLLLPTFLLLDKLLLAELRAAARMKKAVLEQGRENMAWDLHGTFRKALAKIADDTLPGWARSAYVRVLREVPFFDDEMRRLLEECYAALTPGPVRDDLTEIVLQAHHAHLKDSAS